MWESSGLCSLYLNNMGLPLPFDKLVSVTWNKNVEIHFTFWLNFRGLCIFAFSSLPEHWTTVVILLQHLSFLSGNGISGKITSFKIKMKGNFLPKSRSVDVFFTLEKLCFSGSPWYPRSVRHHQYQCFSLQSSWQASWGKLLEGTFWRDSSFAHLCICFSDSRLLKLYVCCAGKLHSSQTLLRKKWQILTVI